MARKREHTVMEPAPAPGPLGHSRGVPFEGAVEQTTKELQRALQDLVARLPGPSHRAVDIQRGLGVDKKLGWQLFRVVRAPQPLQEIVNVPSRWSMERLTAAAGKRGVPGVVIERVARAFEKFEAFVAAHGEDRSSLVSLINGISAQGDQQHELRVRRDLFRGLSHLWGIKAAAAVRTFVNYARPGDESLLDTTMIAGTVGIQRLRRGVPLSLILNTQNDPAAAEAPKRDEAPASESVPTKRRYGGLELVPEFTSRPAPKLVPHEATTREGYRETEIVFPPSGRADGVTLYTSQFTAATGEGDQSSFSSNIFVTIPAELLVTEVLVPEGLSDPETVRASVYGRRTDPAKGFDRRPIDLLPQRETPMYLGTVESVPAVPGIPQHPDAVRHVLEPLGWHKARFDLYRCSVRYPALHTIIRLAVDGEEKTSTAPGE